MVRVTTKVQPFGVVCQTLWQWWIEAFGKGRTVSQLVILSLPTLLICSIIQLSIAALVTYAGFFKHNFGLL